MTPNGKHIMNGIIKQYRNIDDPAFQTGLNIKIPYWGQRKTHSTKKLASPFGYESNIISITWII
jgi:hypothetical protein